MVSKQSAADASLPKKRGRKPGQPSSDAQKAANAKAREVAAAKKRERAAERRALAETGEVEKPRWKQLEDGDIDVTDLTEKELYSRACANNDGSWEGRRHPLPSRIVSRMEAEFVKRMRRKMSRLTGPAFKALRTRLEDDEAPAQQFAAAKMVIEYGIGKVPEVVHIGAETAYDRLQQSAFIVQRGGDLQQELESMDESPDGALDNTGHAVVPGQLEEKEA